MASRQMRRYGWGLALAGGLVMTVGAGNLPVLASVHLSAAALAAAPAAPVSPEMFAIGNMWMLLAAAMVFLLHVGFGMLESGLARGRNTSNVLYKKLLILALALVAYATVGFNLMFPSHWNTPGVWGGISLGLGLADGLDATMNSQGVALAYAAGGYTYWTDFLFQALLAATAATIISGAVAERVRLAPFLLVVVLYASFCYPVTGSWGWGQGGWLSELGFYDFGGSTLVHAVGGWAALMGALVLGPRRGKYVDGRSKTLVGHNLPLAVLGTMFLWLGWFGFNGGAVLNANPTVISYVLVTTNLAAAAGLLGAVVTAALLLRKTDLTLALNGTLAGLVGISGGADVVSVHAALGIGAVAGVLAVAGSLWLDRRLHVDDPVGAIPVHLFGGIWGTLATGLFAGGLRGIGLGVQLLGILAVGTFCAIAGALLFLLARYAFGLRLSEEEELRGLDNPEAAAAGRVSATQVIGVR